MKKIIAISLLSLATSVAVASSGGFYLSGKVGTSIIKLSNQKWENIEQSTDENARYNGGGKTKAVFGGGIALGYDFHEVISLPIRAELDLNLREKASSQYNLTQTSYTRANDSGYLSSDGAKNNIKLNTLMVNAYYDFNNKTQFTPHISVGLGIANLKRGMKHEYAEVQVPLNRIQYASFSESKVENKLAWSLGLGSQYKIDDNLSLDFSYRFLDAGKSSTSYYQDTQENKSKMKIRTNDIMFGAIYRF